MVKPISESLAEDCRYLLAELLHEGYSLEEVAEGCRDSLELIRDIWLGAGYDERAERLFLDLDFLIRHNSFLPRIKKMLQRGRQLHDKMGEKTWNDPVQREQWLQKTPG